MKCPMCGAENPQGSGRCVGCKGEFTPEGVDFSVKRSSVDWSYEPSSSVMTDRERSAAISGYSNRLMGLILYTGVLGAVSSYFLSTGYSGGDDLRLLVGLCLLALFTLSAWMLWKEFRAAYSEPDPDFEPLSSADGGQTHFDLTGLPPRR